MDAVLQLSSTVGIESACGALGVARASFYRQRPLFGPALARSAPPLAPTARPTAAPALSFDERESVRAVLNSERFQDCSPAAIQATLLDEGHYLCSTRTLYRVLEEDGATRERRDQLIHPPFQKPELLANAPHQLWSWDITKLRGPAKWTYCKFLRNVLLPLGAESPGRATYLARSANAEAIFFPLPFR